MRTEMMALRCAVVLLAAAAVVGCSGSAGPICGAGTRLEGGTCVRIAASPACGPGTVQQGQVCLPLTPDGGADASAQDTAAQPDLPPDASEVGGVDAPGEISAAGCTPACGPSESCVDGVCEPLPIPPVWSCAKKAWADGVTCDCGCGALDPDCAVASNPVSGCKSGKCQTDGSCQACVPQCSGKACGDDGCGGLCGICDEPGKSACVAGVCQACVPDCAGKACGADGCGGQCGACGPGLKCAFDQCVYPPAEESCLGHCGAYASSGCGCTAACASDANCCVDVGLCGCLPKCDGIACGDDGCGGTCGSCAAGSNCIGGACLVGVCTDATCNGHGSCQNATATCACGTVKRNRRRT